MIFLLLILMLLFNSHNIFTLTFCPNMPPFLLLLRMCYRGQQGVMRSLAAPLSNGFLMRELEREKETERSSLEKLGEISAILLTALTRCVEVCMLCACVLCAHACAVQLTPCSISRPVCAPCSTLGKEEMTHLYPWMSSSHIHTHTTHGTWLRGKAGEGSRGDVV